MFYHGRFNSLFKCLADLYMKHIITFYVTNNATDYDNFVVPLQPCFAKSSNRITKNCNYYLRFIIINLKQLII
jgi:hypothetical protein